MKLFLLIPLFISVLFTQGCEKSRDAGSTIQYKGVVVYNVCCNVVIQTVGDNLLGENWTDSNNTAHPTYNHVFKVDNPCQFGNHSEGDTLTFTLTKAQAQTCACCMIYVATPKTSYNIHVE